MSLADRAQALARLQVLLEQRERACRARVADLTQQLRALERAGSLAIGAASLAGGVACFADTQASSIRERSRGRAALLAGDLERARRSLAGARREGAAAALLADRVRTALRRRADARYSLEIEDLVCRRFVQERVPNAP